MRLASVTLVFAGLLATAACTTDSPTQPSGMMPMEAPQPTIAEIATGNDDFSTLVVALDRAGLVGTFTGSDVYTVFAPTNAAFDAAATALLGGDATGLDLVNGLDLDTLTAVLLYHVSAGAQDAAAVVGGGSVLMLDGNRAPISTEYGASIDGARIVTTDVEASNGFVHVIDSVLLPPTLG